MERKTKFKQFRNPLRSDGWKRFRKNKLALVGLAVIVIMPSGKRYHFGHRQPGPG